jgi:lipopolysaccharide transport system permease protein
MYGSPVIFSLDKFPEPYRSLFYLNPLCGALDLFRYGVTGTTPLHPAGIALSAAVAGLLFLMGTIAFRQVEQSFADHI